MAPLAAAMSLTKQTPSHRGCFLGSVVTGPGCFLGKHCPKPAAKEHVVCVGGGLPETPGLSSGCAVPEGPPLAAHPPPTLTPHPCPSGLHSPSCPLQRPPSQEPGSAMSTTPHPSMEPVQQPQKTQALCVSFLTHGPATTFLQRKRFVTCGEGSRLRWKPRPRGLRPSS